MTRTVSVFDIDLPPGVAFIRSLGRAGVPTIAHSSSRTAAGRLSRYAARSAAVHRCTAPTSSSTGSPSSCRRGRSTSSPRRRTGDVLRRRRHRQAGRRCPRRRPPAAPTTCGRASSRTASTPPCAGWVSGTRGGDAHDARRGAEGRRANRLSGRGRAAVPCRGVGTRRGIVARSRAELELCFRPYPIDAFQDSVLREEPEIALPIVQRYYELGTVEVISVTGCLGRDGELLTLCALAQGAPVAAPPRCGHAVRAVAAAAVHGRRRRGGPAACSGRVSSSWRCSSSGRPVSTGPSTSIRGASVRCHSTWRSAPTCPCGGTAR